jgi:hypothetical protein
MSSQSSIGDFGQDEAVTETPDKTLDACMAGSLSDWFLDSAVVVRLPSIRPVSNRCRTVPCVFNVCETIAPTTRVISTNE